MTDPFSELGMLRSEVATLRDWKAQALTVLAKQDLLRKAIDGHTPSLGRCIYEATAELIAALRADNARLKMDLAGQEKARVLLLRGMERQAEIGDELKQEARTAKAEVTALAASLAAATAERDTARDDGRRAGLDKGAHIAFIREGIDGPIAAAIRAERDRLAGAGATEGS